MDATGSMTEKLFSVDLTTLLADVNRDGTVDILDLTQVASNLGQQGEIARMSIEMVSSITQI